MKRLAKKFMTGVLTASMAAGVMAVPAFAEGLDTEISVTGSRQRRYSGLLSDFKAERNYRRMGINGCYEKRNSQW